MTKRLYRNQDDAFIGGVASGLAEYLNADPTLIRVIWAILVIFYGTGLIVYLIFWLVVPVKPSKKPKRKTKKKVKVK